MDEPIAGALLITIFLIAALVVGGALRITVPLRHREMGGWWLMVLSGLVSVVIGILLYGSLPWSGLWVLGTLIGVELLGTGRDMADVRHSAVGACRPSTGDRLIRRCTASWTPVIGNPNDTDLLRSKSSCHPNLDSCDPESRRKTLPARTS